MNNIHKYHILSNSLVIHDDEYDSWITGYDDHCVIISYDVDIDKVPSHYNEVEDDIGNDILEYYNKAIDKPDWII